MDKKYLQGYADLTDQEYSKVRITNIDYDIEEEDVVSYLMDSDFFDAYTDELTDDLIAEYQEKLKDSLPTELTLTVPANPDYDNFDEACAEAISETTGWLVNNFDYEILETSTSMSDQDYSEYDRRAVEHNYDLEDGELDALSIEEAERLLGCEAGELDCYKY